MTIQENPNPNQRHGRIGQVKLNPDGTVNEAAERKRLYQNQKSREARARKKLLAQNFDNMVTDPQNRCDKWGITPKDEARYIRCCSSSLYNSLDYVKMRTGLSLKQISVLQEKTNLYPVPPVDKRKADADYKRRYERGDIY